MQCYRRLRGISLIEIMIALLLGLIVTGVLAQTYVNNKQAFRAQNNLVQLQDQFRFIAASFEADLMLAGHWGPIEWGAVSTAYPSVTGKGDCNTTWVFKGDAPVEGYDGATTVAQATSVSGLPNGCVAEADYVADSDIVVSRHVIAKPTRTKNADGTSPLGNAIYLRALVGGSAQFFVGTNPHVLPSSLHSASNPDAPGYFNYRYEPSLYYVRRCRTKAVGQTHCTAAADGGSPIPSLVRLTLNGQTLSEELVVEGVERMQMEYGIDVNSDLLVDCWLSANAVRSGSQCAAREGATASYPAKWQNVVAARMHLLMRSADREGALTDNRSYDIGGQTFAPAGSEKKYRRKQISKIVQIRNYPRG